MKNPLNYQISEYDCGPTSLLNAVSFLFDREEISPVIIRNIMLYCLDDYNEAGVMGKKGTSSAAMRYLSYWLNSCGETGMFPISSNYLSGGDVYFGRESRINDALRRRGAVVIRIMLTVGHYVLLTGIDHGMVQIFDPYLKTGSYGEEGILRILDHPESFNRLVPEGMLNRKSGKAYYLGPEKDREAVILYNKDTVLTPENTIEYFI